MGIGSKLKAALHLDIKQFRRDAKKAKGDVADVGKEASKTSSSSTAGMLKIAGAIGVISAAAIESIDNIDKMSKAIARATSEAARAERARFGSAAQAVNTPEILAAQDVSRGQTATQIARESLLRAKRFALTGGEAATEIKTAGGIAFGANITPARTQGEETALLFAGATGATGAAAAQLLNISRGKLLQHTQEQSERFFSGVAGVAADSSLTPGGFASVYAGIGALFDPADIESGRAAGLINALSLSAKGKPERAETAGRRILGLPLKKNDFVRRAIREGGGDPESRNALDIAESLINFMQQSPGNEEALRQTGQVDRETLESLKQIAKPGARLAMKKGQRLFQTTGPEFLQSKLTDKKKQQTTRELGSQFERMSGGLVGFRPGTFGEAGLIQNQLESSFIASGGAARRNEFVEFFIDLTAQQASIFGGDTPFTEKQAEKLFSLNELFPEIDANLTRIIETEAGLTARGSAVLSAGRPIRAELRRAKSEANSRQTFWGEQVNELPAYEAAMQRAIQFIRQVELGKIDVDTRQTGNIESTTIKSHTMKIAGEAVVGGVDITEAAGGATINTQIINQQGPESSTQNNKTRTGND